MGWRWMRLTGRWSISRGRYEAACFPAHGGLQGPPRHTYTLKPQKGLTLSHVPLEGELVQPLLALSHQPICWDTGSQDDLAGQVIWEGARDREQEACQTPRTRAFSSFIHLHFLCSAGDEFEGQRQIKHSPSRWGERAINIQSSDKCCPRSKGMGLGPRNGQAERWGGQGSPPKKGGNQAET